MKMFTFVKTDTISVRAETYLEAMGYLDQARDDSAGFLLTKVEAVDDWQGGC